MRSTTSSWTFIEAQLGSLWSSWEEPQWNGRIEEVSRFNIRHNCEEKLIEDQDTILELTGKTQELQNEINCMNDSRDFSGCWISTQWTFTRCQSTSVILTSSSSWWNAKPFYRNAEPQRWAATHLGTHMVYRETSLQIQLCLLQHLIRRSRIHGVLIYQKPIHSSTAEKNENQPPVQDPRCQSGPSAKNSVIPSEGDSSKN